MQIFNFKDVLKAGLDTEDDIYLSDSICKRVLINNFKVLQYIVLRISKEMKSVFDVHENKD